MYEVLFYDDETSVKHSVIFNDNNEVVITRQHIDINVGRHSRHMNVSIIGSEGLTLYDLLPHATVTERIKCAGSEYINGHYARFTHCCGTLVAVDTYACSEDIPLTCPYCGSALYTKVDDALIERIKKESSSDYGPLIISNDAAEWIASAAKKMTRLIDEGIAKRYSNAAIYLIADPFSNGENQVIQDGLYGTKFRAFANYLELVDRYDIEFVGKIMYADHFQPYMFKDDRLVEILTELKRAKDATDDYVVPLMFNAEKRLDGIRREYLQQTQRAPMYKNLFKDYDKLGDDVGVEEIDQFLRWVWKNAKMLPEITKEGVHWTGYSFDMAMPYEKAQKVCNLYIEEEKWNKVLP